MRMPEDREFYVDDELVSGEIIFFDDKAEGNILIGDLSLNIDINPLITNADDYYDILQGDYGLNECNIEICYDNSKVYN